MNLNKSNSLFTNIETVKIRGKEIKVLFPFWLHKIFQLMENPNWFAQLTQQEFREIDLEHRWNWKKNLEIKSDNILEKEKIW